MLRLLNDSSPDKKGLERQLISVIVPTRNEEASIAKCLASILAQDIKGAHIEIIVVDGLSTDGTIDEIRRICDAFHQGNIRVASEKNPARAVFSLSVIHNEKKTVPTSLNLALSHARGAIIFRLDGHSTMQPEYIDTCVRKLREHPQVSAVGGLSVASGVGWLGSAYAQVLRSAFGVGGGTFRTTKLETETDTVAFAGYRRQVFQRCGPFLETLHRNQDIEFNSRVRKWCGPLLLTQETHTKYLAPDSLTRIIAQNFRNGCWNLKEIHLLSNALSLRHFVPLAVLAIGLMLACLSFWHWLPLTILLALTVLYLGLGMWVAFSAPGLGIATRSLVPPAMALTHFSYGVGSFAGLILFVAQRLVAFPKRSWQVTVHSSKTDSSSLR